MCFRFRSIGGSAARPNFPTDVNQPNTAIVFPGQGSQRNGMARDFYDSDSAAQQAFEEASEGCGLDLAGLCFEGDRRLGFTEFAQPALLTAEIAMTRVLQNRFGLRAMAFGGHSLGEYSALVAAGVMRLGEAARVVRKRGRLMQEAVPVGIGGMAAVFVRGIDTAEVERCSEGTDVSVANDNSPEQVVVSGLSEQLDVFEKRLAEALAPKSYRVIPLKVSAPFHCPLMAAIEPAFAAVLHTTELVAVERATTVTSNYTGGFHRDDGANVRENLLRQIGARVRWRENMDALRGRCQRVIEIGPAPVLRGFFKAAGLAIKTVSDLPGAEKALGEASGAATTAPGPDPNV